MVLQHSPRQSILQSEPLIAGKDSNQKFVPPSGFQVPTPLSIYMSSTSSPFIVFVLFTCLSSSVSFNPLAASLALTQLSNWLVGTLSLSFLLLVILLWIRPSAHSFSAPRLTPPVIPTWPWLGSVWAYTRDPVGFIRRNHARYVISPFLTHLYAVDFCITPPPLLFYVFVPLVFSLSFNQSHLRQTDSARHAHRGVLALRTQFISSLPQTAITHNYSNAPDPDGHRFFFCVT